MLHQSNYSTDIVGLCHKFMSAGGKLICGSCQCGKINNTVLHFSKRSLDTLDPAQSTRLKDTFFLFHIPINYRMLLVYKEEDCIFLSLATVVCILTWLCFPSGCFEHFVDLHLSHSEPVKQI